ncbi:MAG: 2Fe-2S iron-sulfur cluster-binding protein [Planctomycetota bacterium]
MEHKLSIDGETFAFQPGETLLEVARRHGKEIPTLCHDPRLKPAGACRTCLVEVQGARRLMPACATSASNGAVVTTANARIERHRTSLLSLYLTDHPGAATMETRRRPDQLLDMATRFGAATDWAPLESRRMGRSADRNPYIDFDPAACILARAARGTATKSNPSARSPWRAAPRRPPSPRPTTARCSTRRVRCAAAASTPAPPARWRRNARSCGPRNTSAN